MQRLLVALQSQRHKNNDNKTKKDKRRSGRAGFHGGAALPETTTKQSRHNKPHTAVTLYLSATFQFHQQINPASSHLHEIMDPNSDSMFSGNTSSSSSGLDPMFSGISLQTLLSLNPSLFPLDYPTLSSLTDDPPPQPIMNLQLPEPIDNNRFLLVPKNEYPLLPQLTHQPLNFFPNNYQPSSLTFHRLPQLRSTSSADNKRHRSVDDTPKTTPFPSPSVIPQSNLARQRRQKLSEKTRCLQKLMPWDKKMDQATLLEEAYKYVKFLQSQLTVLHSMPSSSSDFVATSHSGMHENNNNNQQGQGGGVFGDLERLNRNQVLQVLVNSPVAQTMLCSQGFCVFSMEQLVLLRKLSERRLLLQQMSNMSDNASSKPFFN